MTGVQTSSDGLLLHAGYTLKFNPPRGVRGARERKRETLWRVAWLSVDRNRNPRPPICIYSSWITVISGWLPVRIVGPHVPTPLVV